MGWGIPPIGSKQVPKFQNFQSVKSSKFSKFRSLNVSHFQSFKFSKVQSFKNHSKDIDPILSTFHFILLEDIDLIFKMLKSSLNGSSGLVCPHLFDFSKRSISKMLTFPKTKLLKCLGFVFYILVSPQSGIIGFGSHVHVRQVQKS